MPPELICRVFEMLDTFRDVAALAQTGRIFYHTWRNHAMTISRAVGMRSLPNYEEAERLLDVQEESKDQSDLRDDDEKRSISRAKRLLLNARGASAVCADWVEFCQIQETSGAYDRGPEGSPEKNMRPSECARFERSFYILWTIGIMQSTPHMQSRAAEFLENCTAQELIKLNELAMWVSNYNDNNFGHFGIDLRDNTWRAGYGVVEKYWQAYLKEGTSTSAPDFHYSPMGMFAFFDHTQRYSDSYKDRQNTG